MSEATTQTTYPPRREDSQSEGYKHGVIIGEVLVPLVIMVGGAYGLWSLIRRANPREATLAVEPKGGVVEATPTGPPAQSVEAPTTAEAPAKPSMSAVRARVFAQTSCAFTLLTMAASGLSFRQSGYAHATIQYLGLALLVLAIALALIALIRPASDRTKGVNLPAGIALSINAIAIASAVWQLLDP